MTVQMSDVPQPATLAETPRRWYVETSMSIDECLSGVPFSGGVSQEPMSSEQLFRLIACTSPETVRGAYDVTTGLRVGDLRAPATWPRWVRDLDRQREALSTMPELPAARAAAVSRCGAGAPSARRHHVTAPLELEIGLDVRGLVRAPARVMAGLNRHMPDALSLFSDLVTATARRTHLFRDRTGKLRHSIRSAKPVGKFSTGNLRVEILAGAEGTTYARMVHDGTRPHIIVPKAGAALRWASSTGYHFARRVHHPGTKPRPFLREAFLEHVEMLPKLIGGAARLAFSEAGFALGGE